MNSGLPLIFRSYQAKRCRIQIMVPKLNLETYCPFVLSSWGPQELQAADLEHKKNRRGVVPFLVLRNLPFLCTFSRSREQRRDGENKCRPERTSTPLRQPKPQHSQSFPEFCPALLPGRSHVPKGTVQKKDMTT